MRVCLWGMLVSYMLLGCSSQLWHLLLVLLPLCYTGAVASTVNTAQLTKASKAFQYSYGVLEGRGGHPAVRAAAAACFGL